MKRRGTGKIIAALAGTAVLIAAVSLLSCGGSSAPGVETRTPEAASLDSPARITAAGAGTIAVTDFSRGRVVFVNTSTLEEVRHFTVPGNPLSVAVVANTTFVGIPERTENGVLKGGNVNAFDMKGKYLYTLGSSANGYGAVKNPTDMAVDESADRIFVLDSASYSVKAYMLNGTFVDEFVIPNPASWLHPMLSSLTLDTAGQFIYVGDGLIDFGSFSGAKTGVWKLDYLGNVDSQLMVSSLAAEYQFSRPMGLAFDIPGNLMVTDIIQNRVVVVNSSTWEGVRTFAPDTVAQGTNFVPAGIHVDAAGDVYVSEPRYGRLETFRGEGL